MVLLGERGSKVQTFTFLCFYCWGFHSSWAQTLRQLEQMTRTSEDLFVLTHTIRTVYIHLILSCLFCGSQHLCWGVMIYRETSRALCLLLSLFVCVNLTEVAFEGCDRRNRTLLAHPSKPVFRYCFLTPFTMNYHTNWTDQRGMSDQS